MLSTGVTLMNSKSSVSKPALLIISKRDLSGSSSQVQISRKGIAALVPARIPRANCSLLCLTVNNVGWHYSLDGVEDQAERFRLMRRDSTRNLLALHYVVEYCAEHVCLAEGARVINIAGLAVNPATKFDGILHWDFTFHFMSQWADWVSRDNS